MIDRIEEQERFHRLYPNLFSNRIDLECGAGWFSLLDELFKVLERCITEGKLNGEWHGLLEEGHTHPWPCALQIKEKFGGLRVHLSDWNASMRAEIDVARKRASIICDRCGAPGSLRDSGGYLYTRCDLHADNAERMS